MKTESNVTGNMDGKTFMVFLIVFLVSGSVLGFKWMNSGECGEVYFTVKANDFRVGEIISFNDESQNAENWSWEFGDDSDIDNSSNPVHAYSEVGQYEVKLIINGSCVRTENIVIQEKARIIDPSKFPVFDLPDAIMVGQTITVVDSTKHAKTWEWHFGENTFVDRTTQVASYAFQTPGPKTVSLIVNGDMEYVTRKKIEVVAVSNTNFTATDDVDYEKQELGWDLEPLEVKNDDPLADLDPLEVKDNSESKEDTPLIGNDVLNGMLLKMIGEQLQPASFNDLLCNGLNTIVNVRGDQMTFREFCDKVKGKKIKDFNAKPIRDEASKCFRTITINYKKKGII